MRRYTDRMRWLSIVAIAAGLALCVGAARASAPPVGPLPKGPTTEIRVPHGLLFSLVVPRPKTGLVWRGARRSDATVATPLHEAEVERDIVFVYRAGKPGTTTVVYALTRGETRKAYAARFFRVTVT